jgi:Leucine-rich repeat (LRR) protein
VWRLGQGTGSNALVSRRASVPSSILAKLSKDSAVSDAITKLILSKCQLDVLEVASTLPEDADLSCVMFDEGSDSGQTSRSILAESSRAAPLSMPSSLVLHLPRLATLDLSRNRLTHVPPEVFTDLPSLIALDLSHNCLLELPSTLWLCSSLRRLELQCGPHAQGARGFATLNKVAGLIGTRTPELQRAPPAIDEPEDAVDQVLPSTWRESHRSRLRYFPPPLHPSLLSLIPDAGDDDDVSEHGSSVAPSPIEPALAAPAFGVSPRLAVTSARLRAGSSDRLFALGAPAGGEDAIKSFSVSAKQAMPSPSLSGTATTSAASNVRSKRSRTVRLLPQLAHLDLTGCSMETILPSVSFLEGLQTLKVTDNMLSSLPVELSRIKGLTILDAEHNPLVDIPVEVRSKRGLHLLTGVPDEILPGLFLGDFRAAENIEALRARGIGRVVMVTCELQPQFGARLDTLIVPVRDVTSESLGFAKCSDPYFFRFATLNEMVPPSIAGLGLHHQVPKEPEQSAPLCGSSEPEAHNPSSPASVGSQEDTEDTRSTPTVGSVSSQVDSPGQRDSPAKPAALSGIVAALVGQPASAPRHRRNPSSSSSVPEGSTTLSEGSRATSFYKNDPTAPVPPPGDASTDFFIARPATADGPGIEERGPKVHFVAERAVHRWRQTVRQKVLSILQGMGGSATPSEGSSELDSAKEDLTDRIPCDEGSGSPNHHVHFAVDDVGSTPKERSDSDAVEGGAEDSVDDLPHRSKSNTFSPAAGAGAVVVEDADQDLPHRSKSNTFSPAAGAGAVVVEDADQDLPHRSKSNTFSLHVPGKHRDSLRLQSTDVPAIEVPPLVEIGDVGGEVLDLPDDQGHTLIRGLSSRMIRRAAPPQSPSRQSVESQESCISVDGSHASSRLSSSSGDSAVEHSETSSNHHRKRVLPVPLFVHCQAGASRSATIVIALIMRLKGWSLRRALLHVKGRRSVVAPNMGFLSQLQRFEVTLFEEGLLRLGEDEPSAPPTMSLHECMEATRGKPNPSVWAARYGSTDAPSSIKSRDSELPIPRMAPSTFRGNSLRFQSPQLAPRSSTDIPPIDTDQSPLKVEAVVQSAPAVPERPAPFFPARARSLGSATLAGAPGTAETEAPPPEPQRPAPFFRRRTAQDSSSPSGPSAALPPLPPSRSVAP